MNLWAKRAGQLLVAVLFLMSCEDDSFLLGFKNKNKPFDVFYHEFAFPGDSSSVMLIDSLVTDHYNLSGGTFRLLAGQYDDPYFGVVRSEFYTQFLPISASQITDADIDDFESIKIQFRIARTANNEFYYYGYNADHLEKFSVHALIDSINTKKRYFNYSSLNYDPTPLGEISIDVHHFDLVEIGNPDTLLIEGTLDANFGKTLMQYAIDNDSLGNRAFREAFKGIVIVPSVDNKYIFGIDPLTFLSRITIHYKVGTESREKSFFFSPTPVSSSFNKISTQRIGELASITESYKPIAPASGLRYVQSGSPAVTLLDINQFYDFIRGDGSNGEDSLKKIIISSAELSIPIQTPPRDLPPPSTLWLRVLKKSDDKYFFRNNFNDPDSTEMAGFKVVREGEYFLVGGDASFTAVELKYIESEKRYVGRPTIFLQNLFDRKEVDVDVAYFAIYPGSPTAGKSVNRVIFNTNDIKLGVYYTKINLSNLE